MSLYFDHNATTACDERVVAAMLQQLAKGAANASSQHRAGREANATLQQARARVATLMGVHPRQVIFTSGGTEANNLALKSVAARAPSGRIAISAVEHASVVESARSLERHGWEVVRLEVDRHGALDWGQLEFELQQGLDLVSVMAVNNETGTIYDVAAIAKQCRRYGALFHCDAVQSLGKQLIDYGASGPHFVSISAHKIYGPQGVGALIVSSELAVTPLLHGGGQEQRQRGGTENLVGIVGFGMAAEITYRQQAQRCHQLDELGRYLQLQMGSLVPQAVLFGVEGKRLRQTLFFAVEGVDGETLIMALDRMGIAVASGAACGSRTEEPSRVLAAMGVPPTLAVGAVRISLGVDNSHADIDQLVQAIAEQIVELTSLGALGW